MLTSAQFDRTRRLALRLAGIELVERHRDLLHHRSRRLGIRNKAEMDSLLTAVEQDEASATRQLLCLLTTKFTGFFRHPRHFDLTAEQALVAVRRRGHVRLWSAGAATGEEPYSLAMALIEVFESDDPPAHILATDVDAEALALARRGEYAESSLKVLAQERRARFFSRCGAVEVEEGHDVCHASDSCELPETLSRHTPRPAPFHVTPSVRRLVEFRILNLADSSWQITGPFDVILCRNVLMYLEGRHRVAALERMASLLASDGLLMLDPAEHLGEARHLFVGGADGVYSGRHEFSHAARHHPAPSELKP